MRLIDADLLLESVKVIGNRPLPDVRTVKNLEQAIVNTYHAILNEITNAPTVQREGWISVPIEPTTEMINKCLVHCYSRDDVIQSYQAMLSAAPKE